MRFKSIFMAVLAALALAAASAAVQDKIEFKTVDGVAHVFNPAKPLKGTIKLEVEPMRTIDPYEQPEVGMKWFDFSRDEKGSVILYDPNASEGHRFGPDDKYLGLLTKKGQGPGEFSAMQIYRPYFIGPDIWVYGGQKVAHFDASGKLLQERTLKNRCRAPVESFRFITENVDWTDRKNPVTTLGLVEYDFQGKETFLDLLKAANVGMIRNPNGQGGFGEEWATPGFFYAADLAKGLVYCGLNTEYKILAKDLAGKDKLVIHRAFENVKVRRADVEKIMAWALKNENSRWALDAYPDRFAALKDFRVLPKGFLAAYRIAGPEVFEIDIFSPKGEYLYAVVPPAGVDVGRARFFSAGFGTVESSEDSFVYREYRVKNLPEIFGR